MYPAGLFAFIPAMDEWRGTANRRHSATPSRLKSWSEDFGWSTGGRLRRHELPVLGTFLDVRIIGLRRGAIIPIALLGRRRLQISLFDIHRRCGRRRDDRWIVRRIVVIGRRIISKWRTDKDSNACPRREVRAVKTVRTAEVSARAPSAMTAAARQHRSARHNKREHRNYRQCCFRDLHIKKSHANERITFAISMW